MTKKPKIAIGNYTLCELRVGRSCETEHAILVPADDLETDGGQTEQNSAVIDKPARVGATVFRKGVAVDAVILAAQRAYEHAETPASKADEPVTLHSGTTPEGGVIRLSKWPEGYVLWFHGEIVWRSWYKVDHAKAAPRRSLNETSSPPGTQIRTAECDDKDAAPATGQPPVGTASIQHVLGTENDLADLIVTYYEREIGRLMHQAEHWAAKGASVAVMHRLHKADAYFQIVCQFRRGIEGFEIRPFNEIRRALARPQLNPPGKYPPSADLHRYRDPEFVVGILASLKEPDND